MKSRRNGAGRLLQVRGTDRLQLSLPLFTVSIFIYISTRLDLDHCYALLVQKTAVLTLV